MTMGIDMVRTIVVVILACIGLTSCAINEVTAHRYANAAVSASESGDWITARENWRRAYINAKLAHMDNKALAVALYEYGRASGVVCEWEEAESSLKETYRLGTSTDDLSYMSVYELGRMNYDRKRYADAVEQFSKVKVFFDMTEADTKDPLGYADYLDEYAIALEQTGKPSEAQPLRSRSMELRKTFVGKNSHTEKTPYGTMCRNP